jgi:hypothetical protein
VEEAIRLRAAREVHVTRHCPARLQGDIGALSALTHDLFDLNWIEMI